MKNNINIRETNNYDFKDIMTVEYRAFNKPKEADLTDELMKDPTSMPMLSLMAFDGEKAVGHILFTRAYINEISDNQPLIHLLAPLAIIPEYQNQGIGGLLIKEGLRILKERGSEMVFVLGHIDYYPKHGFTNDAKQFGYLTQYPIPEEVKDAWMVQSLKPDMNTVKKGKVICAEALHNPDHWRE